jgi:dihydroorotate dehydrogenase (fumarate)
MDLRTTYLGLDLKNPVVASASPLSSSLDGIRRLEDSGAGAIVLFSLFEEQLLHGLGALDTYLNLRGGATSEVFDLFPQDNEFFADPEQYLELIRDARSATSIPIIGSLNGVSTGDWLAYAIHMEHAGASAIELNLYYVPTDKELSGLSAEWMYLDALNDVAQRVNIPVSVKLSPFFSSLPYMANSMYKSGASGLVLFNRFNQPDLDIEGLEIKPKAYFSRSEDLTLPLRWVSLMYGRVPVDFAVSGGVHTYRDVIKAVMSGAKVAMMAAELMTNGVQRITEILNEIQNWMDVHEYDSIQKMCGFMSERYAASPEAFERASYAKALLAHRPGARR